MHCRHQRHLICECSQRIANPSISRFGPRANPNFYRINASVWSPPGLYYLSRLRQQSGEVHEFESLLRNRATPTSSIHDIAEGLASDIRDKIPAAAWAAIDFKPDTRKNFKLDHILAAECTYFKCFKSLKHQPTQHDGEYVVDTEWYLPISPISDTVIKLRIKTEEHSVSTVHSQMPRLKNPSPSSSLAYVHPTFALHEDAFRIAQQHQIRSFEGAALLLAQSMFYMADEQSPCKRMQCIMVGMREVMPATDPSRTSHQQIADSWGKKFDNKTSPWCKIYLHRYQHEQSKRSLLSDGVQNGRHRVFLALGSNLGNRFEMIESAVREMGDRGLTVHRTSALYETKPMYLENQNSFINGVCEVCGIHASYLEDDFNKTRLKHR